MLCMDDGARKDFMTYRALKRYIIRNNIELDFDDYETEGRRFIDADVSVIYAPNIEDCRGERGQRKKRDGL